MMTFGTLLLVLVVVLVVWAVIALSRGSGSTAARGAVAPPDTPELVLEQRLARGDIDIATYQATRDALLHRPR